MVIHMVGLWSVSLFVVCCCCLVVGDACAGLCWWRNACRCHAALSHTCIVALALALCTSLVVLPVPPPQPHPQFLLFESASGYGLFEVVEAEEIGSLLNAVRRKPTHAAHAAPAALHVTISWLVRLACLFVLLSSQVQSSVTDLSKFSKIVKLKAFQPFESAANALENANNISEGENRGRPPTRSSS